MKQPKGGEKMATAIRVARIRICGDNVELYNQRPKPKDQGLGFIVWRDKGHQKATVLMSGLTPFGIHEAAEAFKNRGLDPTALVLEQDRLSHSKHCCRVKITRRGNKFVLS
jgi:hypothetical protein